MKYFRRSMAIALLVCFFLPMSQCTINHPNGTESANVNYPYEITTNLISEIVENEMAALGTLLTLLIIYFLPLFLELLAPFKRAAVTVIAGVYAIYFLYYLIFNFEPRFGGVLSMALWSGLFIIALLELVEKLSQK